MADPVTNVVEHVANNPQLWGGSALTLGSTLSMYSVLNKHYRADSARRQVRSEYENADNHEELETRAEELREVDEMNWARETIYKLRNEKEYGEYGAFEELGFYDEE